MFLDAQAEGTAAGAGLLGLVVLSHGEGEGLLGVEALVWWPLLAVLWEELVLPGVWVVHPPHEGLVI